ncbi:uncharacterized protein At4g14100-like isoform X2 [Cornus florida]|uniref:uncharacterized protein At4g14100-like isoform X2 n=1 Tax=Cornus florida TaxID=4283 RepID=UPI0028974005|nr:uncharacterized protein At4g14100-like isoform X2 [Cornus florida]
MKKLNGGVYAAIIVILQLQAVLVSSSSSSIDSISGEASEDGIPAPSPWPDQFHALLYMNLSSSGHLQITNLWYDWPRGRNVNIIQKQLGVLLYDVEWNNGTSFYYTLQQQQEEGGNGNGTCQIIEFEVGIPRPDFLDGAKYLGTQLTDGFLCNVWEKVDFIWYYEDVLTNLPVRWDFYDGVRAPCGCNFGAIAVMMARSFGLSCLLRSSMVVPFA